MMAPTTTVHAAEQLLQALPNPSKIKEIWFHVSWSQPSGDHTHTAVLVTLLLVAAIVAIAVCITVYSVKRYGPHR